MKKLGIGTQMEGLLQVALKSKAGLNLHSSSNIQAYPVANILIYSNNKRLIDKCTKALSSSHCISHTTKIPAANQVDVVIVDTRLADNQHHLLSLISQHASHFLMAGFQWSEEKQVNAMLHAASGYYDETEPDILLNKAIKSILEGEIWIQRHLVPKVIQAITDTQPPDSKTKRQTEAVASLKKLSSRELDVAQMITTGKNNKLIAQELNISERTVKAHLTSIFRKLNTSDRLRLALLLKEMI